MKYQKRSQYKHAKSQHRVRNWSEFEAALTIRMVFHLPLRQTEGFLRCLAEMLEVDLPIPDHTTLSRRLKKLSDIQFRKLPTARRTQDCTHVPALLEQIGDPIESVSADGAYDTKAVYEAAHERGEDERCGC